MVQKKKNAPKAETPPRKRGRPRAFAPDQALDKAMAAFRDGGFAATSLDDLSDAMGINRPSLYGTFGDKRALFLQAYERYRSEVGTRFAAAFEPSLSLRQMLTMAYATALDLYLEGDNGPRGCFTVMTAASEAMADPDIRQVAQKALINMDRSVKARLEKAVADGELGNNADLDMLASVVASTFHTIAIRARAGMPRAELEKIVASTIRLICG